MSDTIALIERLRAHAACHDQVSQYDDDQKQWAEDLFAAADLLLKVAARSHHQKPRAWLLEPKVQPLGRRLLRAATCEEPTPAQREMADIDGDVFVPLYECGDGMLEALRASIAGLRDGLYSAERDLVTIPYGRIADRLDAILRATS